jgi:hypothetical protein
MTVFGKQAQEHTPHQVGGGHVRERPPLPIMYRLAGSRTSMLSILRWEISLQKDHPRRSATERMLPPGGRALFASAGAAGGSVGRASTMKGCPGRASCCAGVRELTMAPTRRNSQSCSTSMLRP